MSEPRRTTIYLDPELHRALRLRSASSDVSISEMVNDAVRLALAEDAADLETQATRRKESTLDFAEFVRGLKRRGRL
jgi:hypothetical protein